MKISKKDMMMLTVLGVIIIVALVVVYGIMPAKELSTSLDGQISAKQQEYQKIKSELDKLDISVINKKFDDLYEKLYKENNPNNELQNSMEQIPLEKMICNVLDSIVIQKITYTPSQWKPSDVVIKSEFDGVTAETKYSVIRITVNYEAKDRGELEYLINFFNNRKDFSITNINIEEYNKPQETTPEPSPDPAPGTPDTTPGGGATPDPAPGDGTAPDPAPGAPEVSLEPAGGTAGEEPAKYKGMISLEYYMGDKYVSDVLPKPLDDAKNLEYDEKNKILTFDEIKDAKAYILFEVTRDELGNKLYTEKILTGALFDVTNKKVTINLANSNFDKGEHEIAIRGIGDISTGTFKTILNQKSPTIKIKL